MGDAEAEEAKELMAKLGMDGDVEDEESDEEMDPEEIAEKFRREVAITPDNCLDQVILGTSDLDKAIEQFEAMTGVKPCIATSMNGAGTKSARVAFEECAYLEIIGPDPKQGDTPLKTAVSALPAGKLVPIHYGVRWEKPRDIEVRREWKKEGAEYDQITMVSKDRGMPWMWDMYFIKGDGLMPFIVDWASPNEDTNHACTKLPIVGTLTSCTVSAPGDHIVHKLLEDPANMDLTLGSPKLEFTIKSEKGSHTFTSTDPVGVSFPEEGGIEVKSYS